MFFFDNKDYFLVDDKKSFNVELLKTTLTEKLLLYGGAIHIAGAVKSNKIKKDSDKVSKVCYYPIVARRENEN